MGIILGIAFRVVEFFKEVIRLIVFFGDIFMRMFKMMILFFIVLCMIIGEIDRFIYF